MSCARVPRGRGRLRGLLRSQFTLLGVEGESEGSEKICFSDYMIHKDPRDLSAEPVEFNPITASYRGLAATRVAELHK